MAVICVVLALVPGMAPLPVAAASTVTSYTAPPSGQEITLSALGVPAQLVSGTDATVSIFYPRPMARLAPLGSFMRFFFAHSPALDPTSSRLVVAVNGQSLVNVALDPSTAQGSVFEVSIPTSALHQAQPNLVQALVHMAPVGTEAGGGGTAWTRLDVQTVLHYQLYVPPADLAPSRLDAFPFPLRSAGEPPRLRLVLPAQPTAGELGAALRVLAAFSRSTPWDRSLPEVETDPSVDWITSADVPTILVGTLQRLRAAQLVLQSVHPSPSGAGQDVGVLAETMSGDGKTPLLAVTGTSDAAVFKAAAFLSAGRDLPDGPVAMVRAMPSDAAQPAQGAADALASSGLDSTGLDLRGSGQHEIIALVQSPPVDSNGTAYLELRVSHSSEPASSMAVKLNGVALAALPLAGEARYQSPVRLPFPARLLTAGTNVLTIGFMLAGPSPAVGLAPGSRLALPALARGSLGLEQLPAPFFSDPGGLLMIVTGRDQGTLSAAARVIAELSLRSATIPDFRVAYINDLREADLRQGSVISVGSLSGRLSVYGRLLTPSAPFVAVREMELVPGSTHSLLWIGASSPDQLPTAAAALASRQLSGTAVSVAIDGVPTVMRGSEVPTPDPLRPIPLRLALALIAATLCILLGWQLWRPWKMGT